MLYIVCNNNEVRGVYTAMTDAVNFCKWEKIEQSNIWVGNKNGDGERDGDGDRDGDSDRDRDEEREEGEEEGRGGGDDQEKQAHHT